jgi:regulatory protein
VTDTEPEQTRERQAARARTFVVNSLGARAQSVAEIEAKLAARGLPADVAEEVVAEALRLGYLNDAELAGQLARGYRARGYGRRRASVGLRRRRVAPAEAEAALDEAYGERDEADLAVAALGERAVGDESERRRAVAYLVRRGFSSGVAWQVVRSRGADD